MKNNKLIEGWSVIKSTRVVGRVDPDAFTTIMLYCDRRKLVLKIVESLHGYEVMTYKNDQLTKLGRKTEDEVNGILREVCATSDLQAEEYFTWERLVEEMSRDE